LDGWHWFGHLRLNKIPPRIQVVRAKYIVALVGIGFERIVAKIDLNFERGSYIRLKTFSVALDLRDLDFKPGRAV